MVLTWESVYEIFMCERSKVSLRALSRGAVNYVFYPKELSNFALLRYEAQKRILSVDLEKGIVYC